MAFKAKQGINEYISDRTVKVKILRFSKSGQILPKNKLYISFLQKIYTGDENCSVNPGVSVNVDGTNEQWIVNNIPCPEIIRYREAECLHNVACKDILHLWHRPIRGKEKPPYY